MNTQSSDTSPEVERLQIEALRRLTPAERFQIASRLTRSTIEVAWQSFKLLHPDLDEEALNILWVRHLYGDDLADRVAVYLQRRRNP